VSTDTADHARATRAAEGIIHNHSGAILRVVDALQRHRTLTTSDVEAAIRGCWLFEPSD
jgi:hypothetical protein